MQQFNKIKQVLLSGTPYERGYEHGLKLKEWIYEAIDRTEYYLCKTFNRDLHEIHKDFWDSTTHFEIVKKFAPHLLEELRGLADGANMTFEKIFTYQCTEEIILGMVRNKKIPKEKCSVLGCNKTSNYPTFIGQNLDWMNIYEGFNVLLHLNDEKLNLETFVNTQPGLLACNGMNNAPLAVCVNSLEDDLNCSQQGVPLVILLRLILEQLTLEDAIKILHTIPHASAQNILLGGKDRVANFECSANQVVQYIPQDNPTRVYHTNHAIVNNDFRLPPFELKYIRNTFDRFNYMQYRMVFSKPFTIESAKLLFRSYIGPICLNNKGENLSGMTYFSSIFKISEDPIMFLTAGPPSQEEYQEFYLKRRE